MAERRMFAKTIVLSDAFLDMPLGARCLYMTMGMLADDDGFVNAPKSIMRQTGATEDDLKILLAKKFLLPFESGVIVIKHWRINNYLQKDRIQPTKYQEELAELTIEENGAYTTKQESLPEHKPEKEKDTHQIVGFDLFWSAYPRKVGKEAARKAYTKVKIPVVTLINAIEKQKESEQWKKGYIPNPATWLNQGRWEDEVETKEAKPKRAFVKTEF